MAKKWQQGGRTWAAAPVRLVAAFRWAAAQFGWSGAGVPLFVVAVVLVLGLVGCGTPQRATKREAGGPAKGNAGGPQEQEEKPPPINRLLFGGDVMLTRHVNTIMAARNDYAWPMRKIGPDFAAADLAFVNLESPFTDKEKPTQTNMVFRTDPRAMAALELAGIDVVSFANNHVRDGHEYGLLYTLDLLEKSKILVAGAAKSAEEVQKGVILERQGIKFGFLAYTYDQRNGNHKEDDPRVANMDIQRVRLEVKELRQKANVVVVSMHAGVEYAKQPNLQQIQFGQAAIEAGATLVIGHHPHVTQPCVEHWHGVICYSLGNLVFDQKQPGTNEGLVIEAEFKGYHLRKIRQRKIVIANGQPAFVSKPK